MGLSELEYEALTPDEKALEIARVKSIYFAAGADDVILNLSEIKRLLP